MPQLFQENTLRLLPLIMQEWKGQLYTLEKKAVARLRVIHTDCQCKSDDFVWQRTNIDKHEVEIFACGECGNWSLIMSQL